MLLNFLPWILASLVSDQHLLLALIYCSGTALFPPGDLAFSFIYCGIVQKSKLAKYLALFSITKRYENVLKFTGMDIYK